jgi:flagellar assembly protein FliH
MSLSKLYKANSDFKPAQILEKAENSSEPVWESIVQEDNTVASPVHDEATPFAEETEENTFTPPPATDEAKVPVTDENPADSQLFAQTEELPKTPQEVPEPTVDVESIREEAFRSGLLTGRQQAEEDFDNGARTLINICKELDQLRETILKNSVTEMQELVLAISEKIIRDSVANQCDTITATIKDAIHLAVKSDEFQIQLNPDDLSCIEEKKSEIIAQISGLKNIVLLPDSTVERGGCLIESSCCTVDASLAGQLEVIRSSVPQSVPLDSHDSEDSESTP